MGGFSNVNGDPLGTIMNADNVSFDGTARGAPVTLDGQLLIGSSVIPHIRVGTLTSSDNSITITKGHGTIDLKTGGAVFNSVVMQVITITGTYTPTAGMQYCIIEVVGGGGGGGGAAATGAGTLSGSAGGGGGGYSRGVFSAATIGASKAVTIGAGGSGGTAGNNNGQPGGTTSVDALIQATGGLGGQGAAAATSGAAGPGGGGLGSGGSFNAYGQTGGAGLYNNTANLFFWGGGGNTQLGFGYVGAGGGLAQSEVGVDGIGYGTGGTGGGNGNSQSAVKGGNGASGVVVITEFI